MSYTGGNIQQTYALLQQLYALMQKIETQAKTTDREVSKTTESYKALARVALGYLTIINSLGLPEDSTELLQKISRLIVAFRMLQMTLNSLVPGMGLIQWLSYGAQATLTGMTMTDTLGSFI